MQTSRLTRKESTELTRRRLIDGAIEILRRDGVAAATTGRIASAAGLKQPSFYVHFADRDQVFEAAAIEIGRRVIGILKRQLTAIDSGAPAPIDPRHLRGHDGGVPLGARADAHLPAPSHRRRHGPRRHVPEAARQARGELVESVARYGVVLPRDTAEAYIELLVAAVLGLLEGLLDGRLRDREAAVDAISNATIAMFRSLTRDRSGPSPALAVARPLQTKGTEMTRRSSGMSLEHIAGAPLRALTRFGGSQFAERFGLRAPAERAVFEATRAGRAGHLGVRRVRRGAPGRRSRRASRRRPRRASST